MNTPLSSKNHRYWVVIPAAGVGTRMKTDRPKQYLELSGKTILEYTIQCFVDDPRIAGITVAIAADDEYWEGLSLENRYGVQRVNGGKERCHSVMNALGQLLSIAGENDWVLVHDAARPCLSREELDQLINTLEAHEVGGLLAIPVRDTMKRTDDKQQVVQTVDRKHLWHALTPQMFRFGLLKQSLEQALEDGFLVTDEASAIEHSGKHPLVVEGQASNIKITRPEDLSLAEFFLGQQGRLK